MYIYAKYGKKIGPNSYMWDMAEYGSKSCTNSYLLFSNALPIRISNIKQLLHKAILTVILFNVI